MICFGCKNFECIVRDKINDRCKHYEPREEPMAEEIKMTKEQARKLLSESLCDVAEYADEDVLNVCIKRLIDKGYIRKSELETLVEEAENVILRYNNKRVSKIIQEYEIDIIDKTIQAFKTKFPEWNK